MTAFIGPVQNSTRRGLPNLPACRRFWRRRWEFALPGRAAGNRRVHGRRLVGRVRRSSGV